MRSSRNQEHDISDENWVTNRGTYNPKRSPSHCFLSCSLSSIGTPARDSKLSTPAQSAKVEDFFAKQMNNQVPELNECTVKVKGFFVQEEEASRPRRKIDLNSKDIDPLQPVTLLSNIIKKRVQNTTVQRPKQKLLVALVRRSLRQLVIAEVNSQQSDIETYLKDDDRTNGSQGRPRITTSTDIQSDLSQKVGL